jgi:uncharacterized membrane protein
MKFSRSLVIPVLALVGLAVSAYLLTVHWGWWTAVCLGVGNCELVNTSRYSEFLGFPVALLGMGVYGGMFLLGARLVRGIGGAWTPRLLFSGAAIGVAFSLYLTYIELFVLHEICPWCVLSAFIIFGIAVLSALELFDAQTYTTA